MDSGTKKVQVGTKPSGNTNQFFKDYYSTYGGAPAGDTTSAPEGGLNNEAYRNSLSGYYGGQDYNSIVKNLAPNNTFKPLARPIYKKVDSGGGFLSPTHGLF